MPYNTIMEPWKKKQNYKIGLEQFKEVCAIGHLPKYFPYRL